MKIRVIVKKEEGSCEHPQVPSDSGASGEEIRGRASSQASSFKKKESKSKAGSYLWQKSNEGLAVDIHKEWYLRDAAGNHLAIVNPDENRFEYFIFDDMRFAALHPAPAEAPRLLPADLTAPSFSPAADDPFDDPYAQRPAGHPDTLIFYQVDHLGNTRLAYRSVMIGSEKSTELLHTADYYPFGRSLRTWSYTAAKALRYQSTGHERDRETGLDYRLARFYDSDAGRFLSVDPIVKFHESPYAAMANNPIWFIDPDGRDTVEVFKGSGEFHSHTKAKGDDVFFTVEKDDEGNINRLNQISFDEGTLEAVRRPEVISDGKRKRLTLFEIKGDENAQNLFEFFADPENTNVEFTHAKIGTETSGRNVVGTQNERSATGVGSYLLQTNYTLREVIHNHPGGTGPSGRPGGARGDIPNAVLYNQRNPSTILKVYTHPDNYIYYNQYGITLPPIEVRPDDE